MSFGPPQKPDYRSELVGADGHIGGSGIGCVTLGLRS
jgi:hypothetical protein